MKLKDIAKLVSATNVIRLSMVRDTQWIGNGYAAFPVFGLPTLTEDTAAAVLDFDEDKQELINVQEADLESDFNMRDTDDDEEVLTAVLLRFLACGKTLDAWATESGQIIILDAAYTKALLADDKAQLYLRCTPSGREYVIGKSGMFVTALIMPFAFEEKTAELLAINFTRLACAMEKIEN